MKYLFVKILTIALLTLSVFGKVFAQQVIAVHPFESGGNPQISGVFFEELVKAIPNVPGFTGIYRAYVIDLVRNRPSDVPPGGFPSYICPPPSLTANAAYAITGEIGIDPDSPGGFWLRMYLWQTGESRLLASDMINANDRASCAASYPYILAYLFSVINEQPPEALAKQAPENRNTGKGTGSAENWLHIGLRAGGGESILYHDREHNNSVNVLNLNFAFQAAANIIPLLTVQSELIFSNNFNLPGSDTSITGDNSFWYLSVPVLVMFNLSSEPLKSGIYAGPYWYLPPIGEKSGVAETFFNNKPTFGLTIGLNAGYKLGPGFLFMDIRFNSDLYFGNENRKLKYYPHGNMISLGYELGFFKK